MPFSHYLLNHAAQLTRFAAVGLLCFALTVGVLIGLRELAGVHYLTAYVAAFVAGSATGYLLNSRFTFGTTAHGSGVLRYLATNVVLCLISSAALRLLVEHFHMWYLSATFVLAVLNTPVSFLAHRTLSYGQKLWLVPSQATGSVR